MARNLTGQNPLPPRSPVGNMAQDLTQNARATPPPFDATRNFAPPPSSMPAGPSSNYPRQFNVPPSSMPPGPSSSLAGGAAEAAHGERVNPTLKPSNPAFHGDGRYGAPASATATAPAAPKAPGAASKWFGSADDWRGMVSGGADSPSKTLRMTTPSAPTGFAKGLGALQGAAGAYDAYQGVQEGDMVKAGVGTADAVAGAALFTPAAPLAGAYLGVRGAYEGGKAVGGLVGDQMGEGLRDKIGGTVNQIGLNTGLWGVDDSAKMQLDAAAPKPADTLRKSAPGAASNPTDRRVAAGSQTPPAPATAPPNPGNVTRNGNEYSGADVRGDITINGQQPGSGTISPQNMRAADNLAATDPLRSQGAALSSQSGGFGMPAAAPTPNSSNSWEARNNLRNLAVSASSIYNSQSSWGDKAKGAADVAAFQNAQAMDAAARTGSDPGSVSRTNAQASMFGSKTSAQASNENSRNSLRGTMYTADAQLGAKQMEMQQKLRQQQALGELWKVSNGKPEVFQQLAMQYGMTDAAKTGGEMVAARQTQAQANVKDARSTFESMFTRDGKNGPERDENAEAMANQLADQVAPGYSRMSIEERAAARPKVIEATRMVQGMNTLRNSTWGQKVGIDDPTPAYSQMPDLNGAQVDGVGWLEGAAKADVGRGDTKITLRDGTTRYVPKGQLTEAQQRILEENGAKRAK